MHLTPRAGDIAHTYGGRTYYMDEGYLKTVLDVPLLEAAKRNIAVAAIILVEPAAKCVDPDLGDCCNIRIMKEGFIQCLI